MIMKSTVVTLSTALWMGLVGAQNDDSVGGWKPVTVTNNATRMLVQALTNESAYLNSVAERICVNEVFSLEEQVVSGTNYKFDVSACGNQTTETSGLCVTEPPATAACATPANYSVTIYEQSWTDTLQVTDITLLTGDESGSSTSSEEQDGEDVGDDADAGSLSSSGGSDPSASAGSNDADLGAPVNVVLLLSAITSKSQGSLVHIVDKLGSLSCGRIRSQFFFVELSTNQTILRTCHTVQTRTVLIRLDSERPYASVNEQVKTSSGRQEQQERKIMKSGSCFAACVLWTAVAAEAEIARMGGWKSTPVTPNVTQVLVDAMTTSAANYAASVGSTRVCFADVTAVEQQVVAGTNYRFHIKGCHVSSWKHAGKCADKDTCASPEKYMVQVFEQVWTNTLQVTAISEEKDNEDADEQAVVVNVQAAAVEDEDTNDASDEEIDTKISDEEKSQIDAWIEDAGRNQYGDEPNTMYTGGTPLFDETTGQVVDRYDYILSRHPDRPWKQSLTKVTVNLAAAAVDVAASTATSTGTAKSHDLLKVLVSFGVFTVILAGVATLKRNRSRGHHRFKYESVVGREIM